VKNFEIIMQITTAAAQQIPGEYLRLSENNTKFCIFDISCFLFVYFPIMLLFPLASQEGPGECY
jgi:hypothetical protein